MFCLWEKFSQRVCHIQIRKYFANFYVNNALHRATLANCSHFQYVSRLRLRVIWISVKTCIDVTLYDEPFVTSIIEKHILIPLRIILTAVQWSTPRSLLYSLAKLRAWYTIGLVHSIGNDFHSLSIFCRGRVLSLTQLHTLQLRQELLLWLIHLEHLQDHVKVCAHLKVLLSVLIYPYR